MPIDISTGIHVVDQEEFHALNRPVLGIIFDIHNQFGRLLDESLFKVEILARCEEAGIVPTHREVRVQVTHDTFSKNYFLDLLCGESLLLEIKTAEGLTPAHRAQILSYLLLTGLQHGMLINMRPERVQHELASTRLTPEIRRRIEIVEGGWTVLGKRCADLRSHLLAVLEDWGAFLEIALYREAMVHFLGGSEAVIKTTPVYSGSRLLGLQRIHLVEPDTAFSLTAVAGDTSNLREHMTRFLGHTKLKAVQWINLNHHRVEFTTLLSPTS